MLSRTGTFVVVAPTADHLRELVGPLGLVGVDDQKDERLATKLAGFERTAVEEVAYELRLDHAAVEALVGMGPSAFHLTERGAAAARGRPARPRPGDRVRPGRDVPCPRRRGRRCRGGGSAGRRRGVAGHRPDGEA